MRKNRDEVTIKSKSSDREINFDVNNIFKN